jgi:hypothetical protein
MGMKQTLDVLNRMEVEGVIDRYAIGGAVGAYNYIEPTVTEDLDILVSFESSPTAPRTGLITLEPILRYLRQKGYSEFRKEGIVIENWAVQFLPVANDLDAEALAQAENVEIQINPKEGSVKTRVLRREHLVATALRIGRPKDLIRITQFLEDQAVDMRALCDVIDRHGLKDAWTVFCRRTGITDPCKLHFNP